MFYVFIFNLWMDQTVWIKTSSSGCNNAKTKINSKTSLKEIITQRKETRQVIHVAELWWNFSHFFSQLGNKSRSIPESGSGSSDWPPSTELKSLNKSSLVLFLSSMLFHVVRELVSQFPSADPASWCSCCQVEQWNTSGFRNKSWFWAVFDC